VTAVHQSAEDPGLFPYEIADLVDHELSHQNFGAECSDTYISAIPHVCEQHIITPLVIIRKQRASQADWKGAFDTAQTSVNRGRLSLWSTTQFCANPLTSVVVIDNTARVTEEQLQNFLVACRAKFIKAKIEPGISTSPVACTLLMPSFQVPP